MTALHFVQLQCSCGASHPPAPVVGSVTDLRRSAAAVGWEVMRGTRHGKDSCPSCRIAEIEKMAKATA